MAELKTYRVREPQGNIYGPADMSTLRQWVGQGRIVAGMSIAEEGTPDWQDVATHAGLADLFGQVGAGATGGAPAGGANPYAASTSQTVEVTRSMNYASMGGQQLNIVALISMIAGILGLPASCCCNCFSVPFAITAIVMGIIALRQFRATPYRFTGKGMAIAGLTCGILALVLSIVMLALGLALNLGKIGGGGRPF